MGLKALGHIIGIAKTSAKPAKNCSGITNPIKSGMSCVDKFCREAGTLNREEILAKVCAETGAVSEDLFKVMQAAEKNMEPTAINHLLELSGLGKIKLFTPVKKERMVFIMNRNASDGLLLKQPEGVLNYISSGNADSVSLLRELLALEKEGKLGAENISQLQKMYKAGYEQECLEFIELLKGGQAANNNVNHALLMVENQIPFEIFDAKNLSKFTKDEIREFALNFQSARGNMDSSVLNSLRAQLNSLTKVNTVSKNVSTRFLTGFDNLTEVFAKSSHSVEELANAGGVQLAYSREALKSNIFEKLKGLPEIEQQLILEKFGLSSLSNGRMGGLPIYLNDTGNLSKSEFAINEEIGRFLTQNEILLPKGFEEFRPAMDEICRTFPEFMFTIGSKQHGTHVYALSEHILAAFQNNLKNPLYKELSQSDRKILGIATILHDINKTEKVVDKAHPFISAQTTEAILQRMEDLTVTEKNRIINFVENHHWLERISASEQIDPKTVQELALSFRSGNDFKMAKIFAESDLKAVNSAFWTSYGGKINSPMTQEVENVITTLQANGRLVYTTDVTLARAIEAGAECKNIGEGANATKNYVISAKQLGLDTENVIYHAAEDDALIGVASACGHKKNLILSASVGREGHLATFQEYPHIVGFRQYNMNNIGSAFLRNTKYGKDYEKFNLYYMKDKRFTNKVKQQLSFSISDEQYARVFNEASGIKMNEIHSNRAIQEILGGEKQAAEFEKAVANVNKELESTMERYGEVVVCDPELGFIGTKNGVESLSYELRRFCEEKNIPIVEFH